MSEIKRHPKFTDYGADRDGNVFSFKFGKKRKLKPGTSKREYLVFNPSQNGISYGYWAHRFIFECWFGPIPEGLEVHHWDGEKTNNQLDNLALMTCLAHRRLDHSGEKNSRAKLTWVEVDEIRKLYQADGWTLEKLGEKFGVVDSTIFHIIHNHIWKESSRPK